MAQATLQEMAREVYLYSGEVCPILLAQRWVRDRYRSICERQIWSFKLGRSTFFTPDAYTTGTVTMTFGSAVVTGSSTLFQSGPTEGTLVGQQLKVNNGFIFTIVSVDSESQVTVDQPWLKSTLTGTTYNITQTYITPTPSDFHAFYSVTDPDNGWLLRLAFNVKELDRVDARRAASGTPRILANGVYNSSNVPMYELWPGPTAQKQYMYTYEKRVADLTLAGDTPPKIIRSDVLVKGALADLARWPGTPEKKNPMFDAAFMQWRIREAEFKAEVDKLIVEDQSILQTDLTFGSSLNSAPLDAKFMQNHAFGA